MRDTPNPLAASSRFDVADGLYAAFPAFADWQAAVDARRWDRILMRVNDQRRSLGAEAARKAFELVKRAAAVDTGAIEGLYSVDRGFTFTIAAASALWEQSLAERGPEVRSLIEAQLEAYDLAVDVATNALPITEVMLRRFHEELCRAQPTYSVATAVGPQRQRLPLGEYKHHPNHVQLPDGSIHPYCPVARVPAEMHRLVTELTGAAFEDAHPVVQASYAHYGLVAIHPFADGNGRVARLLASVYLCRGASIPFLLLADEQRPYWDALAKADEGRHAVFVDFVMARAIDTLRLVSDGLLPSDGTVADSADRLRELRASVQAGDELDRAANRIIGLFYVELKAAMERVGWDVLQSGGSSLTTPLLGQRFGVGTDNYRSPVSGGAGLMLTLRSWVGTQPVVFDIQAEVPNDDASAAPLVVRARSTDDGQAHILLEADLDEISPEPKKALDLRIRLSADRLIKRSLDALRVRAERELGSQ
jgi:Fic/DOC family